MPEVDYGSAAVEAEIPECCEDCPVARSLSAEAIKVLVQNCAGPEIVKMGCDEVKKCGSPDRRDIKDSL